MTAPRQVNKTRVQGLLESLWSCELLPWTPACEEPCGARSRGAAREGGTVPPYLSVLKSSSSCKRCRKGQRGKKKRWVKEKASQARVEEGVQGIAHSQHRHADLGYRFM